MPSQILETVLRVKASIEINNSVKERIAKACELLKDLRMKTYEISSAVGYGDDKYFSYVFKKYVGITPTQYREQLNIK